MRKYPFSERVMINEWNKSCNDCINHASSANCYKKKSADLYLIWVG